jgi:hypothetical protein
MGIKNVVMAMFITVYFGALIVGLAYFLATNPQLDFATILMLQ